MVLDGILEGKLPPDPEAESWLRDWLKLAAQGGLRFSLEVDGNSFSLLANNAPIDCKQLPAEPSEHVAELIRELLKVFPPDRPAHIFSTLRSAEYGDETETQTVYTINPRGIVKTVQRTVNAETTPREEPLTRKEKLRILGFSALFLVAVVGVMMAFGVHRILLKKLREGSTAVKVKELAVETPGLDKFLTVAKDGLVVRGGMLLVKVDRTADYPLTDEELNKLFASCRDDLRGRLAVEAIGRGYVRCEYFDAKGRFLGATPVRIRELEEKESIVLAIPLPQRVRVGRIVLTY